MSDVFINDLKLNVGRVRANITLADMDMSFNNRSESVPGQYRGIAYPISGDNEEMVLGITIYGHGSVYTELVAKRQEIINVLRTQATQKIPLLIRTPGVPIYEDFESVYVLAENVELPARGKDGNNLYDFKIDCIIMGVPRADGGTISLQEIWEVEST